MRHGNFAHNGQAQAAALAYRWRGPKEAVEYLRPVGFRNAWSVVFNGEHHIAILAVYAYPHAAACLGVDNRVLD